MPTSNRTLIELDGRGRVSIGKYAGDRWHYFIDVDPATGIITLTPAVVMTETEAALARNPELARQIEHALTHPETRVRRDLRQPQMDLAAELITKSGPAGATHEQLWETGHFNSRASLGELIVKLADTGKIVMLSVGRYVAAQYADPAMDQGHPRTQQDEDALAEKVGRAR